MDELLSKPTDQNAGINKLHNMTHDVKDIDPSNPFMTKSNNMQNSSNGDNGQSSTVPIPISSSSPDSNSQYQR